MIATMPVVARKHGRPRLDEVLSEKERKQLKDQVFALRQQGLSRKEICETCKLSQGLISSFISDLIKEKLIKSEQGNHKAFATWRDLKNDRTQLIIGLCKKRLTLQKIGNALGGLTRERARQLIKKISETHGSQVFQPTTAEEIVWTPKEAEAIGVSSQIVYKLCRSGEVPYLLRGSSDNNSQYLLTLEGIEALCLHPAITRKRVCALDTCKKTFIRPKGSSSLYCSDQCREQWRKNWRFAIGQNPPNSESLQGWHKELWQKLQKHTIPENEEWITITKAAGRTGLSCMQLWYLAYRKMITIKLHPTKVAPTTGKPVMLYSVSEMEIAKKVFQSYKKTR